MVAESLTSLAQPAKHVIWVVAQGLGAETLSFYNGAASEGPKVEVPNLKAMAQIGTTVADCVGLDQADVNQRLASLWGDLSGAGSADLPAAAAKQGKLWLSQLPYAPAASISDAGNGAPRCQLQVNLRPDLSGPLTWDHLLATQPEVVMENVNDHQLAQLLAGIVDRFPGRATQAREALTARTPLDAWLYWFGDAFLRSIWYALARPGGIMAFLYHPGPALYAAQAGTAGYRRGVEALDELVGRLMVLQEHDQAEDMLLVVTGDGAWHDPDGNLVPVFILGPHTEPGTVIGDCLLTAVTSLVEASL